MTLSPQRLDLIKQQQHLHCVVLPTLLHVCREPGFIALVVPYSKPMLHGLEHIATHVCRKLQYLVRPSY